MALGAALARRSELEEAGKLLDRGLANLRARGQPLDIADALLVSAPVRRALEAPAPARAMLEEARKLLATCPDPGVLSARLVEVARTLTPAHRRIEGDSDLTERELEVLRYLAEGLSKREIGKELFLSFNTIHSHTKSIYQKLRVSSRQDAIARARELGALSNRADAPLRVAPGAQSHRITVLLRGSWTRGRRSGSRCGSSTCRSPRPGARPGGSAGSSSARTGASRP